MTAIFNRTIIIITAWLLLAPQAFGETEYRSAFAESPDGRIYIEAFEGHCTSNGSA